MLCSIFIYNHFHNFLKC